MRMTRIKMLLSGILCAVLMAAMALGTGCNGSANQTEVPQTIWNGENTGIPGEETLAGSASTAGMTVMGQGEVMFYFTVKDRDGKETGFEIHTDRTRVGDALLDVGLIVGEMGDYGLYVKTVNGITADFDVDQTYWAFYINGQYAMTGVDVTEIEAGATYSLRVEK